MKDRLLGLVLFSSGCLATLMLVMMLGSASSPQAAPRYHADFDTILGGLGGLTIEVTDHQEEKAFLYVISPSEKGEDGVPEDPQLIMTVDLSSAGQETLDADLDAWKEKEADD